MSPTLKVKLGSSFFPLAIAKTLPPTFQTCDPPHWTTWVVAERARQNALNSPRVILPCFTTRVTSHLDERPTPTERKLSTRTPLAFDEAPLAKSFAHSAAA